VSEAPTPPELSPDGKFYWNGTAWMPLPVAAIKPTEWGVRAVITIILLGLVLIAIASNCGAGFTVTVDPTWTSGSADVSGTIVNGSKAACSDPEITLHLRDHNGAIVRDFTFGAGELAQGQTRKWSTHMVWALFDAPVESNVTAIDADAECVDKH
jgi:hypothetical protein